MEKLLEKYPAVLSVADIAEILSVTKATVRKLIREKKIASINVGRLIKVPKDKLIEYLNNTIQ